MNVEGTHVGEQASAAIDSATPITFHLVNDKVQQQPVSHTSLQLLGMHLAVDVVLPVKYFFVFVQSRAPLVVSPPCRWLWIGPR